MILNNLVLVNGKKQKNSYRLKENDVDAVLIGETLMKSDDKKSMIAELKNG